MRGGKTLPALKKLICQWVDNLSLISSEDLLGPERDWKNVLVRYMEGVAARNRLAYLLAAIPYYVSINERFPGLHKAQKR